MFATDRSRLGLAFTVNHDAKKVDRPELGDAETAKDTAVADAATQVGAAAGQVGDAAEQTIEEVFKL